MARKAKELALIGTKVGRLTVVSQADSRERKRKDGRNGLRKYWKCECECGNLVEVRQDAITGKRTNSCGCLTREVAKEQIKKAQAVGYKREPEDLTGMVFGRLTVVEPAPRSVTPKGRELVRWKCSCSCGGEIDTLHESLKNGKVLTCGCVPPEYADSSLQNRNEVFIHRAKDVHGDKYDYSLTEYKHSTKDVVIICPLHGPFRQKPSNHLTGHGCAKCAGAYSGRNSFLSIDKIGSCPKHGKYNIANGCVDCFSEEFEEKIAAFVEEAMQVHGDRYDYTRVFFETRKDKVVISCEKHGVFRQRPSDHLKGQGCPECGKESKFLGVNTFIERSETVHGDRYDYSLVDYKHSNSSVEIICKIHGIFLQKPSAHMNGQKCPKCASEERAAKQHWNYLKRCELDEELARSPGVLYLIEVRREGEHFLKVGVSSNFTRRLGHFREESLSVTVLATIESTSLQVAHWEKEVLDYIRERGIRYIPEVEFRGWTECATIDSREELVTLFEEVRVRG